MSEDGSGSDAAVRWEALEEIFGGLRKMGKIIFAASEMEGAQDGAGLSVPRYAC